MLRRHAVNRSGSCQFDMSGDLLNARRPASKLLPPVHRELGKTTCADVVHRSTAAHALLNCVWKNRSHALDADARSPILTRVLVSREFFFVRFGICEGE